MNALANGQVFLGCLPRSLDERIPAAAASAFAVSGLGVPIFARVCAVSRPGLAPPTPR